MGIYFSSLTGEDIDNTILALKNMCPQIQVSGATASTSITCTCSAISYEETLQADASGKCTFYLPQYGDYVISGNTIQVYEFKIYTLSLS